MGLLDHLFKPRPDEGAEKTVEAGESPAVSAASAGPDPTSFLHPKDLLPRAASAVLPVASFQTSVRPASTHSDAAAKRDVVLTVGDLLARIPPLFVKMGGHDSRREVVIPQADISSDIARGRATISLTRLAQICPELFHSEIAPDDDVDVRLPLQKLLDQLRHFPSAQTPQRPPAAAPSAPAAAVSNEPAPPPRNRTEATPPPSEPAPPEPAPPAAVPPIPPPPPIGSPGVVAADELRPRDDADSDAIQWEGPGGAFDRPGEERIFLSLAAILARCPDEIFAGQRPKVSESVRVGFPFAPIERQLVSGHVEVTSLRFVSLLPPGYKCYFKPREGVRISLPLEEIFQNLPGNGPVEEPEVAPIIFPEQKPTTDTGGVERPEPPLHPKITAAPPALFSAHVAVQPPRPARVSVPLHQEAPVTEAPQPAKAGDEPIVAEFREERRDAGKVAATLDIEASQVPAPVLIAGPLDRPAIAPPGPPPSIALAPSIESVPESAAEKVGSAENVPSLPIAEAPAEPKNEVAPIAAPAHSLEPLYLAPTSLPEPPPIAEPPVKSPTQETAPMHPENSNPTHISEQGNSAPPAPEPAPVVAENPEIREPAATVDEPARSSVTPHLRPPEIRVQSTSPLSVELTATVLENSQPQPLPSAVLAAPTVTIQPPPRVRPVVLMPPTIAVGSAVAENRDLAPTEAPADGVRLAASVPPESTSPHAEATAPASEPPVTVAISGLPPVAPPEAIAPLKPPSILEAAASIPQTEQAAATDFMLTIPPVASAPAAPASESSAAVVPPRALAELDQDRLQALFLTEDFLDLPRIAEITATLPGLQACGIERHGATSTRGRWPVGFDPASIAALSARVAENTPAGLGNIGNFTLVGEDCALSVFARPAVRVSVVHAVRGFSPGVREKLGVLADELAR